MTDDFQKQLDQSFRELSGPTSIQKQIILLKFVDLYENQPESFGQYAVAPMSPEREWISAAGALVRKYKNLQFSTRFDAAVRRLNRLGWYEIIIGIVSDVIAEIRLELELDGRSDIGTVYKPGEVYDFYKDLKEIIAGAEKEVFLVEPYLTGQAFDEYFGTIREIALRLLVKERATEVKTYANKHAQQYQTSIEVRKSKELHDRLIVQDNSDLWVIGGSLNMKGDKSTYLLPLTPGVAETARNLYADIWNQSNPVS